MALRKRGGQDTYNPWPGYVDALSTLLMVIIFVLLVFVLAQAFLSVTISGRDQALDRLNRQMAELSDMLALEKGRSAELRTSIGQLSRDLQSATATRDSLSRQLAALRAEQDRLTADRDTLKSDRDRLAARLSDSDLQAQAAQARTEQLQAQLADAAKRGDAAAQAAATTTVQLSEAQRQLAEAAHRAEAAGAQLADLQRQLAAAQDHLEEMRKQAAEYDRTVQADRATIDAKLSELATMAEQVRNLTALRAELERRVQDAAVRATTEEQRRAAVAVELADEKKFSESARAQMAAMTAQMTALREQIARLNAALEASAAADKDKDVQIAALNTKLINSALAQKVEELQRYRSEFFGKLRDVLVNRPGIQVVGDRFVFKSDVLFPLGSADLTSAGQEQITQLAATLKDISREIPTEVNWILRVDGHADRQRGARSAFDNWELSAGRAITVVKLLIASGIDASRLAATGFGEFQPLDPADTPEAYARNRRIEIRLTDR